MFTLEQLKAALPTKNYARINEIAAFLMLARLPEEDHLKAAMSYTWSLEKMGFWDRALMHYQMLETLHADRGDFTMASYMVARQAHVMRLLGRVSDADEMLDNLSRRLDGMSLTPEQRSIVQDQIDRARATVD